METLKSDSPEALRLEALASYGIMDTDPEEDFNEIVQLASQICNTPVSLITLLDENRQWFKARKGLAVSETPIHLAFCAHTIKQEDLMEVKNADEDERFAANELVTGETQIKFYAGTPLTTPNGYRLGTLCVIDSKPRELTEDQKNALRILANQVMKQLELRLKIKKLREFNDSNAKLLSILSHDVRRPLHHIFSLVQLAEKNYITAEQFRELTAHVKHSVQSTEELLDNLIQWAVSQFEGKGLQFQWLNLQELIAEEVLMMAAMLDAKQNKVANTVGAGVVLFTDPDMLKVVVRNILSNANKYTEKGSIIISAKQKGHDQVEICIADNGKGIREERLQKLFNWNNRVSAPGTKGEKGSALGLQVVHEFLQKLKGAIHIESKEGLGTKVIITLPRGK